LRTPEISDHNAVQLTVVCDEGVRAILTRPVLVKDHMKLRKNATQALRVLVYRDFNPKDATERLQRIADRGVPMKKTNNNFW
jgi:hypothetical protein